MVHPGAYFIVQESGFLRGSMDLPWAPMGGKVPWSLKC